MSNINKYQAIVVDSVSSQDYRNTIDAMHQQASYIKKFAKPLYKEFGINGCLFHLIFEDGATLHMPSNPLYEEEIFDNYLDHGERWSVATAVKKYAQKGFFILDSEPEICKQRDPMIVEPLKHHNYDHFLTSVDELDTLRGKAIRLIVYMAPEEKHEINRFYLNNLDLFKKMNNL